MSALEFRLDVFKRYVPENADAVCDLFLIWEKAHHAALMVHCDTKEALHCRHLFGGYLQKYYPETFDKLKAHPDLLDAIFGTWLTRIAVDNAAKTPSPIAPQQPAPAAAAEQPPVEAQQPVPAAEQQQPVAPQQMAPVDEQQQPVASQQMAPAAEQLPAGVAQLQSMPVEANPPEQQQLAEAAVSPLIAEPPPPMPTVVAVPRTSPTAQTLPPLREIVAASKPVRRVGRPANKPVPAQQPKKRMCIRSRSVGGADESSVDEMDDEDEDEDVDVDDEESYVDKEDEEENESDSDSGDSETDLNAVKELPKRSRKVPERYRAQPVSKKEEQETPAEDTGLRKETRGLITTFIKCGGSIDTIRSVLFKPLFAIGFFGNKQDPVHMQMIMELAADPCVSLDECEVSEKRLCELCQTQKVCSFKLIGGSRNRIVHPMWIGANCKDRFSLLHAAHVIADDVMDARKWYTDELPNYDASDAEFEYIEAHLAERVKSITRRHDLLYDKLHTLLTVESDKQGRNAESRRRRAILGNSN